MTTTKPLRLSILFLPDEQNRLVALGWCKGMLNKIWWGVVNSLFAHAIGSLCANGLLPRPPSSNMECLHEYHPEAVAMAKPASSLGAAAHPMRC